MYEVYIIQSLQNQRYYVGSTQAVANRRSQHNSGQSVYTRAGAPWVLVHVEQFASRAEAMRMERRIKARGIRRYLMDIGRERQG